MTEGKKDLAKLGVPSAGLAGILWIVAQVQGTVGQAAQDIATIKTEIRAAITERAKTHATTVAAKAERDRLRADVERMRDTMAQCRCATGS